MAWNSGYIELDCGTQVGIEKWDDTFVGDDVFCPKHRAKHMVKRMSRISETTGSRDSRLGVMSDGDAGAGAGPADPGAGA